MFEKIVYNLKVPDWKYDLAWQLVWISRETLYPTSFIIKIANAIDYKNFLASVILDLSKAFGTIKHSIL